MKVSLGLQFVFLGLATASLLMTYCSDSFSAAALSVLFDEDHWILSDQIRAVVKN